MSAKNSGKDFNKAGKTDWKKLDRLTDAQIERAVLTDSDAELLEAEFWRNAKLVMPEKKQAVSLRIDSDVLSWFKQQGRGYQTLMNAVLRSYAKHHR